MPNTGGYRHASVDIGRFRADIPVRVSLLSAKNRLSSSDEALVDQPYSPAVLLAGAHYPAQDVRLRPYEYNTQLLSARAHYGNALCECRRPALKLQIRERAGKLHLAAWPGQGSAHAFNCPFYSERDHQTVSVEGFAQGSDGRLRLKYVAPLTTTGNTQREEKLPPAPGSARMWALLHHLWMGSGLNRWYPGWRRDWGLTRHVLLREAAEIEIEDTTLDRILYVPRVFTEKSKNDIEKEWQSFVRPLTVDSRGQSLVRSSFVLGVVRTLTQAKTGYHVTLQQHAASIFLPDGICRLLAQRSRRGWSESLLRKERPEDKQARVVVMLRVQAYPNGALVAVDGVMMRTTKSLIPSNTTQEDALANALQAAGAQFSRPLAFDQRHGDLPTFVLRQADGSEPFFTDMYCIPLSTPRHSINHLRLVYCERAYEAGHDIWIWDRHEGSTIPKIPSPNANANR